MERTCLRLKRLLLSRWLCLPPATPELRLQSDSSIITASFLYKPPSAYNEDDHFELQACSAAERTPRLVTHTAWLEAAPHASGDRESLGRRAGLVHLLHGR